MLVVLLSVVAPGRAFTVVPPLSFHRMAALRISTQRQKVPPSHRMSFSSFDPEDLDGAKLQVARQVAALQSGLSLRERQRLDRMLRSDQPLPHEEIGLVTAIMMLTLLAPKTCWPYVHLMGPTLGTLLLHIPIDAPCGLGGVGHCSRLLGWHCYTTASWSESQISAFCKRNPAMQWLQALPGRIRAWDRSTGTSRKCRKLAVRAWLTANTCWRLLSSTLWRFQERLGISGTISRLYWDSHIPRWRIRLERHIYTVISERRSRNVQESMVRQLHYLVQYEQRKEGEEEGEQDQGWEEEQQ